MATNYLQLVMYDKPDAATRAIVAALNLVMNSFGPLNGHQVRYVLNSRQISGFTFKEQWNDSPVLDGESLVDFRYANQRETISLSVMAQTVDGLRQALSTLNHWALLTRAAQRDKMRGLSYRPCYLAANPLSLGTYTTYAEIKALTVNLPPDAWSNEKLVNLRCDDVVLNLTLGTYWTASVLPLVEQVTISNSAGNYVSVTGDINIYSVANAVLTSNIATLKLTAEHALDVGDTVVIENVDVDAIFNGTFVIADVPSSDEISYAVTHTNISSTPAASGTLVGQYVKGSRSAPLRVKIAGGSSATNRLMVGVRKNGTPRNFRHVLWAKDARTAYGAVTNAMLTSNVATLTIGNHILQVGMSVVVAGVTLDAAFNGTFTLTGVTATSISYAVTHGDISSDVSAGTVTGMTAPRTSDTTLDGNGTNAGTRTTALSTSETLTHRWIITSNVLDQYSAAGLRAFLRARSNTAERYSARVRVGLTDGTNFVYAQTGGYSLEESVLVGTSIGNALAFPDVGRIYVPGKDSGGAAVYGLVYELYVTCSDVTGSPTLDVDGLFLLPAGEGAEGTGLCAAQFDLGTGATGVGAAFVDALNDTPNAYLANALDVVTFPTLNLDEGTPIWFEPERAYRVFFLLIDNATSENNPRHDHTVTMTVTLDYEIRHGTEGRVE